MSTLRLPLPQPHRRIKPKLSKNGIGPLVSQATEPLTQLYRLESDKNYQYANLTLTQVYVSPTWQ